MYMVAQSTPYTARIAPNLYSSTHFTHTCIGSAYIPDNILQVGGGGGGLASLAPCCTQFGYLPSHSYIPAHMHAIRCCKQGCERTDLAHMKSLKERVKGTDYVNSTSLILQLYSIICGACTLISSCLRHVT